MITFEKFDGKKYENFFVVTDSNLSKLYNIAGDNVFLLPCGENAKNLHCVQQICSWLLSRNAEKTDTVVAVGGGSVGDTVGFAASVYKRGIKLLHVPTTLVAQIDSSIGGKTAVSLDGVKNAVGTFYSADTLIDVDFLETLDEYQMKNGYGELLKYRMLDESIDKVFLNGDLLQTIQACVEYKTRVCQTDPFDAGVRKILNFGHTVGHALELSLGLSHGEAVANGLYYETLLAEKLGLCNGEYSAKWRKEIERYFTLQKISEQNLQLTLQDKKNCDGKVCMALPCDKQFVLKYISIEQMVELLVND